jgi:outer membrane protein TolC
MILLFLPVFLSGQERLTLDLDECIKIAMENNHEHKQQQLDYEKAKELVDEAYGSALFPSIDASVAYNRAVLKPRFIIETPEFSGNFEIGSANTLTANISLEQPIFTGAMFLAVDIAKTYAEISKKATDYSESELRMKVKEAYYTHLLAGSLVDLSKMQIKRAEENLKNSKSMLDAGLTAEYDYIRANVQYQNFLPTLTEALNQSKLSRNNLKLIMGISLDTEVEILDSLTYFKINKPDFDEGLDQVYSQNDLIKQRELQTELQNLNKSYQFTEHFPKVTLNALYQTQTQEEDSRAIKDWRYFNSFSIGMTLRIPIFKGFTIDSKVEQAELDYKIAVEGLAATKKSIRNNFENLMLAIEKNEEQIVAYNAAVDEAQRGYDISVKRFNSGLGTQLEVTDAQLAFTNTAINLLQSVHEYYIAHARLEHLLGENHNVYEN